MRLLALVFDVYVIFKFSYVDLVFPLLGLFSLRNLFALQLCVIDFCINLNCDAVENPLSLLRPNG